MEQFSKKEYLHLQMPTEEIPVGDRERIALALEALGYGQVSFPSPPSAIRSPWASAAAVSSICWRRCG